MARLISTEAGADHTSIGFGGTAPSPVKAGDDGSVSGRSLVVGRHRPALDGIRAVAMSVMLAYHSELPFARGAFLGLSQFFTLSGFLITGLLLQAQDRGGIRLRGFWSRRFKRLMPAALLCLVGIVIYGATVASYQQANELPGHVAAAATNTANWFFIITDKSYIDLFASPSPVQHYWSLAVEEQFYLLMPLVMLGLMRMTRSPRVLAMAFGGMALVSTAWMVFLYRSGAGLDRIYYGTDTRMAEILMGGLLAVLLYYTPRISRRALGIMGSAGVVAYLLTAWGSTTLPLADGPIWQGGFLVFSVISCTVILGVVSERGPLSRLFTLGPLPAMGRLTYGLYLYHWPIYLWLTAERTGLDPWPLFALRLLVTFGVAIASYHLVEMPVRTASWSSIPMSARLAVGPVAVVLVIASAFVFTDRSGEDPLATLRSDDRALEPPVTPADGVLDLLVITDAAGADVVDRMEEIATGDGEVQITRAQPFACEAVAGPPGHQTCVNWTDEWTSLISDHNPDAVLLYVDDWPVESRALLPGANEEQVAFIGEVLGSGFDVLTARGAPVIWSMSGAGLGANVVRSTWPFVAAATDLEQNRTDVRRILGGRLPDVEVVPAAEFVDQSARALLADASLYQRNEVDRLQRVMIIGDSQARSLGYGLERWAAESERAAVWNVATEGCGLADEGATRGFGSSSEPSQRCLDAVALLPSKVESFRPDTVVVLTSMWDIQDRAHPSWTGYRAVGDPAVDAFLRREFDAVVDAATVDGAMVVWMTAPCSRFQPAPGQTPDLPDAFAPERSAALNQRVLEPLARDRSADVALFDLDAALCPDDQFRNEIDGVENVRSDGVHFSVDGALWFADTYGDDILAMGRRP